MSFAAKLFVLAITAMAAAAAEFDVLPTVAFEEGYSSLFGGDNVVRSPDDRSVRLVLDQYSGSGFRSSRSYMHGFFSAAVRLPANYTAGVVVAFYMSNGDDYAKTHDEVDFEFLGNVDGRPWRVQSNVYGNGSTSRGREERYSLPFDPTTVAGAGEPHRFSISWSPDSIIRHADQGGEEELRDGRRLPVEADVGLRHNLGRVGMGDRRRKVQGRLRLLPFRLRILPIGNLRRRRRRRLRRRAVRRREGRGAFAGAEGGDEELQESAHDLLVLQRRDTIPGRLPGLRRSRGGGSPEVQGGRQPEGRRRPLLAAAPPLSAAEQVAAIGGGGGGGGRVM